MYYANSTHLWSSMSLMADLWTPVVPFICQKKLIVWPQYIYIYQSVIFHVADDQFVNPNVSNGEYVTPGAPCPRGLQLDRQLASSILVSWQPPEGLDPAHVRSYHVFLDGDFKMLVRGTERTKALLENVESRKVSWFDVFKTHYSDRTQLRNLS